MTEIKETNFFQDDDKYRHGIRFYEETYFSAWGGQSAKGEISPNYMYFEKVPRRIYKELGAEIKLIFMLRNPVDRAYSNYMMNCRKSYESFDSFAKAVQVEQQRITKSTTHKIRFSYLSRGYYAKQIKRYLEYFPKQNMFFIVLEEDLNNIKMTIRKLLRFLEVDVTEMRKIKIDIKSNPGRSLKSKRLQDFLNKPNAIKKLGRMVIPNHARTKLITLLKEINSKNPEYLTVGLKNRIMAEYFSDEIRDLESIIERDLSLWY